MVALAIPHSYQTPNYSADWLLSLLTGDEYKVLHYAMRQTFGFQRDSARISLSQFQYGKSTADDSRVLDTGTGLSKPTIINILSTLHRIGVVQQIAPNNSRNEGALYRVCISDECVDYDWLRERHRIDHALARSRMAKVRAKKAVNTVDTPTVAVNAVDAPQSTPFTPPVNRAYTQNPDLNPDQIQKESAATSAAIPVIPIQEEVDLPEDHNPSQDMPPSPLVPPPPAAPIWNVGDAVYYIYTSGDLHTVAAVVIGLTKQKVKIATHEKDRNRAVVWPTNLQPRRRDSEPEAWEVEALANSGTKEDSAPKPQSALTKAMFEAIPEDIRPVSCHYGKNDEPALAVMKAGWSAAQVALFTEWLYATNEWYRRGNNGSPVIISMHSVSQKIKGCWSMVERWDAQRKISNEKGADHGSTTERATNQYAQNSSRFKAPRRD